MDEPFRDVTIGDGFAATYTLYIALLIGLVYHFTPTDGYVMFIFAQTVFTGLVFIVWQRFFNLAVLRFLLPVAAITSVVHVIGLGYLYKEYDGTDFKWIFVVFMVANALFAGTVTYLKV